MGGSIAEANHAGGTWSLAGYILDLRAIDDALCELHDRRVERWHESPHYRRAIGETWALVRERWPSIVRVADLLLERTTVNQAQIEAVL